MELDILTKIGFTQGEIRVYEALLKLGKSSTGKIMEKSNISSSKVYLTLDKLVHKGLVSFFILDNVKYFQPNNPISLSNYIKSQKEELNDIEANIEILIPKIASKIEKQDESSQVYKGFRGIMAAYNNILDSLSKGEEYCLFAIDSDTAKTEKVLDFFTKFHENRSKKCVKVRVIADSKIFEVYRRRHLLGNLYSIRHHPLSLPTGIVIGKDRITFMNFGDDPTAYEIVSSSMTRKYKDFFNRLWKTSKY